MKAVELKVVYIAGPYRADTPWLVECNIRRAEEVGLFVAECGAVPLIPHTLYRYFDGCLTGQFWIDATMELLKRADGILMLEDYTKSSGSMGELEMAEILKHKRFFESDDYWPQQIAQWVKG